MDVLYHYCSTTTFHSIIEKKSIWLSSLSLSNDWMEGKLVTEAVRRLAEQDGLPQNWILQLQQILDSFVQLFDGLGFCLSENGDLLSQWRGYGSDATGIAIGFSSEYFEWLSQIAQDERSPSFKVFQVEYNQDAHDEIVKPTYQKLKQHIDDGAFRQPTILGSRTEENFRVQQEKQEQSFSNLLLNIIEFLPDLFRLKPEAFKEEQEWRLISHFVRKGGDECLFRVGDNQIIPYRNIKLLIDKSSPVQEIILGPKHGTPVEIIKSFLKQRGYGDVKVLQSKATYR